MNPAIPLVIASVALVFVRFRQPWVPKAEGEILDVIPVPIRARVRLQRTNVYAVGALMVLGGAGGWLPAAVQIAMAVVVLIGLLIPVTYTLTRSGIALGRTPARAWSQFTMVAEGPGRLELTGADGVLMHVWLPEEANAAKLAGLIRGLIATRSSAAIPVDSRPHGARGRRTGAARRAV
jgi:hypothetical protein